MLPNQRIGDLIEVPSVQTVVRLENSVVAAQNAAGTFVFTSDVDIHIRILAQALERTSGQGYFLQGDFGSGKSHFLAALAAWLGGHDIDGVLSAQHEGLQKLHLSGKRFLPVTLSLVNYRGNTPLERIITEGIEESLRLHDISAVISERSFFLQFLKGILHDPDLAKDFSSRTGVSPDHIPEWINEHKLEAFTAGILLIKNAGVAVPELPVRERNETFDSALQVVKSNGFAGIVLLIDELSEFFRSKPDAPSLNEDARTLQLIGEMSKSNPLWIIAAVQESIERTGDIAQATFRKIKDRFPHKFHLSTLHIRDLIAKRLVRKKPGADQHITSIYNEYSRCFPAFNATAEFFSNIYPVHPLTLSLLEGLGDLFSQHRGIVDFVHSRIAGDLSGNIPGILDRPCSELLSPDAIYEHFAPRIAEFSSFYIYPSQIVPHLDQVIDLCHEDETDRVLARKLIRILILYAIHPTASAPSIRVLAELASCMFSFHDPDTSAQYISEVLLDPIVEKSRFLNKNSSITGYILDATYVVSTSDDQSKILRARIERTMKELALNDSRILSVPLAELPESFSWPGPSLMSGNIGRTIIWRQSTRQTAVFYLLSGNENSVEQKISEMLNAGKIDFALVITTEKILLNCKHTAMWIISVDNVDDVLLREYFACRMVAGELRPANPADVALIPLLKEQIRKLEPAARQAVLHQIYSGSFTDLTLEPESPVRQIKRFDRLLEIAGEQILESRFPRFKEIASRSLPPSPRYYQRLFDDFVVAGSISMRDARTQGLSELIETMAVPLGLVDVKAGNYLLTPNTVSNQFLSSFFSLLPVSGQIPTAALILKLQTGPYGVPRDLVCFLVASLAYIGHISLINRGRSLPLEFIKISTVEQIDAIAPGDIISEADRKAVVEYCTFLTGSGQIENFGLKQQRDTWQAVLKFKASASTIVSEIGRQIQALSGYSAFSHFDLENVSLKCRALTCVLDEIKVSYSAREGLERFLVSWRASGLTSDDITYLKQIHRFLIRHVERIVFVNHYINHRSAIDISSTEKAVADRRDAVLVMLRNIDSMIIPDEGEHFQNTFEAFRESFVQVYSGCHARYQKVRQKPIISKHSSRALLIVKRLASIPSLDCPRGIRQLLDECEKPLTPSCTRNVSEELLRSPLCSCGYLCTQELPEKEGCNPDVEIERVLREYTIILRSPQILEAISARSFALRDVDKSAHDRLGRLHNFLRDNLENGAATLRDLLDESTSAELNRALSGQALIENRSISALQGELAGRRLTPSRIREIVEKWIGDISDDVILSLADSGDSALYSAADPLLWPFLHKDLFSESLNERKLAQLQIQSLASELEKHFSSDKLSQQFIRMNEQSLLDFISNEPVHLGAIQAAWNILIDRILSGMIVPQFENVYSKYLDESEAMRIKMRMGALQKFSKSYVSQYPEKLRARSAAVALYKDPWATNKSKANILANIEKIAANGNDWFMTLPVVPQINCTVLEQNSTPFTMILVDAIPLDVWLDIVATVPDLFNAGKIGIFRQTAQSVTVDSINELFGFSQENDPTTELALRGIDYFTISGDEERKWSDIIPLPKQGCSQLVRLTTFDRQAHAGNISLEDIAPTLANLLSKNLASLVDVCKNESRSLIVTTDHGLSFSSKGLSHGAGGIYEKAIFRFQV